MGETSLPAEVGSSAESLCGKGWLSRRAERVLLLTSAIVSSDAAKRIAPLKYPSSSFAATRAAKFSRGALGTVFVNLPGTLWGGSGSACSLITELTWNAKLLRWPPLLGTLR